jgi:Tol biopolymer transport system component/predicted Ser/Thr protein kinase
VTLAIGARLGPYEIVGPLGAGGMGEVYKARDTRLERTVAVKVLPAHLSANEALRERLEREAKAISSLSHPHICALYDVGHEAGTDYLVMEYLEGETLADRLRKGPLPTDELLRYGTQIADALDRAHRRGLVHRDLKPGNVMLTREGAKLLDFGLAKVKVPHGNESVTASPTLDRPLTAEGTILGTWHYMAPEQLEGKAVDARSDLFAFGALLHEMATGLRAFGGESQASVIGAIMRDRPPAASTIRPTIPPALDRVIAVCLAKDPQDRWQTAHDLRLQLEWIAQGGSQVGLPAPVAARRRLQLRLAWVVAALGLAAAAVATFALLRRPTTPPPPPIRFEITLPPEVVEYELPRVSPDGRRVALMGTDAQGGSRVWLRALDDVEARPLPGTEGAWHPFWSPDSRALAFFADGKLKRVDVSGGAPVTLCEADGYDGTWGAHGVILFDGTSRDPLRRVAASGGVATPVRSAEELGDVASIGWPEFLPDGRHFLYVVTNDEGHGLLRVGDLESSRDVVLGPVSSRAQYAWPGYLLFVRDQTLVAQPFDADSLEVAGDPVPLVEDMQAATNQLAHFSASQNGVLVSRRGQAELLQKVVWVDRDGRTSDVLGEAAGFHAARLSPKEDRLAFGAPVDGTRNIDLWVRDLARGVTSRVTFDDTRTVAPVWSPDGTRIAYASEQSGTFDLYIRNAEGTGEAELLLSSPENKFPTAWSRDGRLILYMSFDPKSSWDLWTVPADGQGEPQPFLRTPFPEVRGDFSPDARYVTYESNETGQAEVYVQDFPGPGRKWRVSTEGGTEPTWSADGRTIYYLAPGRGLMAAAVSPGKPLEVGVPKQVLEIEPAPITSTRRYDVSADGRRFLFVVAEGDVSLPPLSVLVNWSRRLGR